MTPTAAAARAPQSSAPSLRDRLKDPSLLREQCYIDGVWTGTPAKPVTNPVNGVELAKVPVMSTAEATQAVEAAERAFPAWAKLTAKQRSNILRKWFDLIIANREDLALILTSEQGKPLAEALGEVDIGGAYVEFFAEEARRVYGETLPTPRPGARLVGAPPADRRLRRDHAVEFSVFDDHPQGLAGAGRRLHRGVEARQRDAAHRVGTSGAGREGRRAEGGVQHPDRQFVGDRQGAVPTSRRALRRLHRIDRSRENPVPAGRGRSGEARARARRQRTVRGVRRRRYRCRGGRRHGFEIPQHGPDLCLRQPHLRPGQDLRSLRGYAFEESRGDEDRRRHRARRDAGSADQYGRD